MNIEQARLYHSNNRLPGPYPPLSTNVGYAPYAQLQNTPVHVPPSVYPHRVVRPDRKRPQYTRSKTGCLTCRQKKVKCDETKPFCTRCVNGHRECAWPEVTPVHKKVVSRRPSKKVQDSPETSSSTISSEASPVTVNATPQAPNDGDRYTLPPIATMDDQLYRGTFQRSQTPEKEYDHQSQRYRAPMNGQNYSVPLDRNQDAPATHSRRTSIPMAPRMPDSPEYYHQDHAYHSRRSMSNTQITYNGFAQTRSSMRPTHQPSYSDSTLLRQYPSYNTALQTSCDHQGQYQQYPSHRQTHGLASYAAAGSSASYTHSPEIEYSRPSTATSASSYVTRSSLDSIPYNMGHFTHGQ